MNGLSARMVARQKVGATPEAPKSAERCSGRLKPPKTGVAPTLCPSQRATHAQPRSVCELLHLGRRPPLALFLGRCVCGAGGGLQSPLHNFLGRTAYTASERRFQQLLPVRC